MSFNKKRNLLFLSILCLPFVFFIFHLFVGKGAEQKQQAANTAFNTELPGVRPDKLKKDKNKLDLYKQADRDSLRRREWIRQDPYFQKTPDTFQSDHKMEELLQKMDRLRESIRQPVVKRAFPAPEVQHLSFEPVTPKVQRRLRPPVEQVPDTVETDPQLEKLNGMLDKIIRIQHPTEPMPIASLPAEPILSDTAAANSLPAVVQNDQVLVAGATIALRLIASARVNGLSFPKDQLVYGVVSISNDRMMININSIRRDQSIYSTSLQVYDLDGLPGIHIPGDLGRETAKQSVDQSINSMGVTGLDGSPAAQVTNAGILTARTLLSRKVRMVRVAVQAGYQVLLRNTRSPGRVQVNEMQPAPDSIGEAPDPNSFLPFLHKRSRHEKMELTLQGIYLRDSLLWLVLRLENHSPIGYTPGYMHWTLRHRKQARRTAIQDIAMKPLYTSPMETLPGDSSRTVLTAFRPFALPKGKELVLQLAENNGARELVLDIREDELLKVKRYEQKE